MKPWFEREAKVIKFPEPEKKVVQMPNVASYPDFITGAADLKAKVSKGEISQDSHDKLYTDLIHRFMKKESFETPWFLREVAFLSGKELFKYPGKGPKKDRLPKFISDIQNGTEFAALKTGETKPVAIKIDPKELPKIQKWISDGKPEQLLTLRTSEGPLTIGATTNSPFKLVKTKEYGGQQPGLGGATTGGKESKLVKISDLGLTDRDIPAKDLGNLIINNKILKQSTTGKIIINMAKNILAGSPSIKNVELTGDDVRSIRDYAGEYLGILMIVKKLAIFPNRQPFYKHLKISNLDQLVIKFPSAKNNRLADGFGTFAGLKNIDEGFTINISVKGGPDGRGAPPALSNFKVPDEFRKEKKFAEEIEFIDANANRANNQFIFPFVLLNIINKYHPTTIPSYIKAFLPFNVPSVLSKTDTIKYSKDKNIQKIYKAVKSKFLDAQGLTKQKNRPENEFFVVHFATELAVEKSLEAGALPDLSPLFREMLQQNFVQVSNTFKNNTLQTEVLWPNTDLASGNVTYDSKNSMTRIAHKACIRIE